MPHGPPSSLLYEIYPRKCCKQDTYALNFERIAHELSETILVNKLTSNRPIRPPRVAIICDVSTGFGRDITRGATRFANLRREWELCTETVAGQAIDVLPECDGAIVGFSDSDVLDLVSSRCKRVVYCPVTINIDKQPAVRMDDHAIGILGAEHLIGCGFRNFAFYGWPENGGFDQRRYEGFMSVLKPHGYRCSSCQFPWPPWSGRLTHNHHPQLLEWIESLPKPLGVMCVSDMQAHDLASACLTAGIHVPERIAIVGVDDDSLLCDAAWPPLSSVACDFKRMGYEAAKTLKRMLIGETLTREEQCIRLPPLGVTQRQSTDVVAVSQPDIADALRFIREHACDPCTVNDILRAVPVGRRWLEMQFNQLLGRSPHDEINRVRVDIAKRLLGQPDLSLEVIANMCGFSAVQSFNRTFQKAIGKTPAAYRRERQPRTV